MKKKDDVIFEAAKLDLHYNSVKCVIGHSREEYFAKKYENLIIEMAELDLVTEKNCSHHKRIRQLEVEISDFKRELDLWISGEPN